MNKLSSVDRTPKYSDDLFKAIYGEFKTLYESLNDQLKLKFSGLWPFLYYKGSNSLKASTPCLHESIVIEGENEKKLRSAVIDCDYGSLGFSFKKFDGSEPQSDFLYRTFNDPRGVVCSLDSKIEQEHAIFISVTNTENGKPMVLGVLDLFFIGKIEECDFKKFSERLFKSFKANESLKRLCVNAFKIKQFEELLTIQSANQSANEQKTEKIENAVQKIEEIIAISSNTPVFYIKNNSNPISPKLVGLNFELIHGLISHEYRFCSLVKKQINCFYQKGFCGFNLSCHNIFLKYFYYVVINELKCIPFKKKIKILDIDYVIEYFSQSRSTGLICTANINKIEEELKNFSNKFPNRNNFEIQKLKDELVFSLLKDKLKGKADVLILYRMVAPHLSYSGCCTNKHSTHKDIKEFISPSNLLQIQYCSDEIIHNDLVRNDLPKSNVVHFEILEKGKFIKILKEKISAIPDDYCKTLSPYVESNLSFESELINNSVTFHYAGANPFFENNYESLAREQTNLISNLLQEDEIKRYATRAAISQVMARNLSHNHGSHVLSKLTTSRDFERLTPSTVDEITFSKYIPIPRFVRSYSYITKDTLAANLIEFKTQLRRILTYADIQTTVLEDVKIQLQKIMLELYVKQSFIRRNTALGIELTKEELLANFMLYQKQRMDFLADIATSTPTLENTKFLLQDIMAGLDNNRILLEHISGTDIKYSFTIKDCRSCSFGDMDSKNGCGQSCSIIPLSNAGNTNDVLVSVPNDVLGQHAFYVIIENIIRNTAKHATIQQSNEVEFTIEVHECEKDKSLFEFVIYDDCEITGDKTIDKLIYEQNFRINQSILDPETNQLRHGAWGLVEMDVSAAYLRKIDIAEVNDDIYAVPLTEEEEEDFLKNGNKIPTLQAVNKNNCLAYRFYMNKPKEILILDENGEWWKEKFNENPVELENFRSQGILILHNTDDLSPKYKFDAKEIYPHHILLTIDELKENLRNPNIPGRIISRELFNSSLIDGNNPILTESERTFKFEEFLFFQNTNAFKEQCWRCWVLKLMELQGVVGFEELDYLEFTKEKKKRGGILFDDHGQFLNPKVFEQDSEKVYVEVFNHNQKPWVTLTKIPSPDKYDRNSFRPIELFKLIEGILSPVIIIDERVQAFSKTKYKPQGANWDKEFFYLFKKSGVIIPDSTVVNLNAPTFNEDYRANLVKLLTSECQGLNSNPFLVIHLGVIEKILKVEGKQKGKDEILKFVGELGHEKPNMKIIITSGRGKPDNLPSEVPFLSFSIVSQFTIENSRFKAFLVQSLQAARPLKNNN